MQDHPCPNCGYCPTCGRGRRVQRPLLPTPVFPPYIPIPTVPDDRPIPITPYDDNTPHWPINPWETTVACVEIGNDPNAFVTN